MAEVTTTELMQKYVSLASDCANTLLKTQSTWLAAESAVQTAEAAIANIESLGEADLTNIQATKLITARTIAISGDGTGSALFDGASDVTLTLTLADTLDEAASAGPVEDATSSGAVNIPYLEVDAKGRITELANRTITINGGGSGLVTQTQSTTNAAYPLLLAAGNKTGTTREDSALFCADIKANPFTGAVSATTFTGAFNGNLTGNADTATKATKDGSGNTINGYYMPFTGGKFTGGFFGKPVDLGTASAINLTQGSIFKKTITANTTFTISGLPTAACACFTLILTNGGTKTVSWFSGCKWPGDVVPTLVNSGVDVLTFVTFGDGKWYGVPAMQTSA